MPADWMTWSIGLLLSQFSLAMTLLALVFILFHIMVRIRYVPFYEIVFRWVVLFPLGFTGIYTFYMHVFRPEIAAAVINWPSSPFQFEVGMADLAIGILGIIAFKASYGFRMATVIASTIFLWGCGAGHVFQMIMNQNYSPGNAGSWFWLDMLIPLVLILCISRIKPAK